MMRKRGGPGIMSTMARTAVIAGTATAVSGSMQAKGAAKQQAAAQQHAAQHAAQQEKADMQARLAALEGQAAPAAPAAGGGHDEMIARLQQLASLHEAGILNADEFAAAKAKLLAG